MQETELARVDVVVPSLNTPTGGALAAACGVDRLNTPSVDDLLVRIAE